MKYLIHLITAWGYSQKYEVHDNSVQFTFKFGKGFEATMTNNNIEKEGENWELELFNSISKHRDKIATEESLEIIKFLLTHLDKNLKELSPISLDKIYLN